MSDSLALGVVGHVDHGKTALVRALTGIETDRLAEEQARGLSIVLGFSYFETRNGIVDLIDAPGHEDFVRTMISGATGFDGILLCVDAREGPKPQTIEHFQIVRLLGAARGVIAITKCDLADAGAVAAARDAAAALVRGSFLEGAPVVECSAVTGAGIAELGDALAALAAQPVARTRHDAFFMPIDRAFTMRGFGLVVTGTLRWGAIAENANVTVVPAGIEATVRGLQNHGTAVTAAEPGQRVAVNLRGLGSERIGRGDVLASPGLLHPVSRIDAGIELLEQGPGLRHGELVQLLTGTTAVTARARLLDSRGLEPGQRGLVQWRLERPIATHVSERFIVRALSPRATIGGGRFVELGAERHRRFDSTVRERLASAASGDAGRVIRQRLAAAGTGPVDLAAVAAATGIDAAALRGCCIDAGAIEVAPGRFVDAAVCDRLAERIIAAVESFHAAEPRRTGIGMAAAASEVGLTGESAVFRHIVGALVDRGEICIASETLSRPGFDPFAGLGERERAVLARLEQTFVAAGVHGPAWRELIAGDRVRETLFGLLLKTGRLVRLRTYDRAAQIVLHADVVRDAIAAIDARYPYPTPFAVKDVRDLLGSTRRHIVPLMEHLDAIGATERTGDHRRLRPQ